MMRARGSKYSRAGCSVVGAEATGVGGTREDATGGGNLTSGVVSEVC